MGGGPAGATAALFCAREGLRVLLIDKRRFPRDKICGDAIPKKAIEVVRELGLEAAFDRLPHAGADAIVCSAPGGASARIAVPVSPGGPRHFLRICRRTDFDNLLFAAARREVAETVEGCVLQGLLREGPQVSGVAVRDLARGETRACAARLVIGADGYGSMVARSAGLLRHDPRHSITATRAYYEGLDGLGSAIEVHFMSAVIPGYFWIFPLGGGRANVGLGLTRFAIRGKKVDLAQAHVAATLDARHAARFGRARQQGPIRGWNLPLGSGMGPVCGDGFLLVGDAAHLVDPFSGEGIGYAMISGKLAAHVAREACQRGDFRRPILRAYESLLLAHVRGPFRTSRRLQRAAGSAWFLDWLIGRAQRKPAIARWMAGILADERAQQRIASPLTYARLLFG